MTNDLVKRGYNKIADNYLVGRDQFKSDKYLEKLNFLISPASTILDVGCGSGVPVDQYLIKKGHKIVGVDISERQIKLAKKNVPEGEYEVKDMSELKEREYKVDAVVSFYAIFHTPREQHLDILRKLKTFLTKNGYLLVTMGSSEWEGREENFFGGEMFWSHYGAKENRMLLEKAGFKVLLDEIDETGREKHQVLLAQAK